MSERYTVSVVGAGMGGQGSMKAVEASHRFDLVAVADWSGEARARVEECNPGVRTFKDYQTLFAESPTDVVVIATWPPKHLEVTKAALELPLRGIIVEKPLADNYADGGEILREIRSRSLPTTVPHGLLVARHSREILDRVRCGEIGDVRLVSIECTGWDIVNAGIHWMNYLVNLLSGDPVVSVQAACDASSKTYRDGMQVETEAVTYVSSRSGARGVMQTGDYLSLSNRDSKAMIFRIVGESGSIEFHGWEPRYWMSRGASGRELFEVDPGRVSNHGLHFELLAAQMDSADPDYGIAESSLAALEIVEAAYLSSWGGFRVTLPLGDFDPPEPVSWEPGIPYRGTGGGRNGRRLPPI